MIRITFRLVTKVVWTINVMIGLNKGYQLSYDILKKLIYIANANHNLRCD